MLLSIFFLNDQHSNGTSLLWISLFLICNVVIQNQSKGQSRQISPEGNTPERMMTAHPTSGGVTLDGRLDEAAWQEVMVMSDFKQFEPVDGAPASQRTEVRVLYGPDNLYVGAILHDENPELIEKTLGRRDDFNRADWFLVAIDSYYDRRNAYVFGVNAAGVQFDALQAGTGGGGPGGPGGGGGGNAPRGMDPSWDAIWYSQARVEGTGWVVELRIPYSMLRFADAPDQTWGIHFTRRNPRLGEQSEWPHVPRIQRDNLIAQFGQLQGIQNVNPRKNIQITPYTVSQVLRQEDPDEPGSGFNTNSIDVGGDLKIGFGPNVTLDATINPDFGQVEADPAVLNLTAFEIFFQERRPFFVEGIQIYEFAAGPGQLLYTRRIGADTPIIGATKLSGRTNSGMSFGILGATTGDKFNPNRGYGVARVSQQLGSYSTVGGILTLFDDTNNEDGLHLRSTAIGADWDLRLKDNLYGIEGFFALTNRNWVDAALATETGFAGKVWGRKRQGTFNGFIGADVFSDQFNPNDLGQLRANNFIAVLSRIEHEINNAQPFGPFQRGSLDFSFDQQFSYDESLNLGQEFEFGSRMTWKGFQSSRLDITYENPFGGYDIFESRGLLPWAKPVALTIQTDFETDERKNWRLEPGLEYTFFNNGGREIELSLEGTWNPGSRVAVTGEIRGEWENDAVAWTSNESFLQTGDTWSIGNESNEPEGLGAADFTPFDDAGALDNIASSLTPLSSGQFYASIFGQRDTRSLDFTLRSTLTFTPTLSLQVYSQLFAARGQYHDFLLHQSRDELVDFDAFPKRDEFAFSSLQSNVVLRWEYRPGSSLFLVWTHGRQAEDVLNPLSPWGASPYDRSLNNQFDDTFNIFPDNVFLIKLNYTFLY